MSKEDSIRGLTPKGVCESCGKIYYGWALYKKEIHCECGGKVRLSGVFSIHGYQTSVGR